MGPYATQYYYFNIFTIDKKTVWPLLQVNSFNKMPLMPLKKCLLCQALSSEHLEI